MFQYIYEIYVYGLKYLVPTALILSIISIPELKRELAFKYLLGYTATGLCIGYTYPISCPLLAVYLLKDFEKEKEIRTIKKENVKIEIEMKNIEMERIKELELKLKLEQEINLDMERKLKEANGKWKIYVQNEYKYKKWF
jgi:hypothetical protein